MTKKALALKFVAGADQLTDAQLSKVYFDAARVWVEARMSAMQNTDLSCVESLRESVKKTSVWLGLVDRTVKCVYRGRKS